MARARNIKPGFFKNEILGVADPLYSLLFEGLWVLADRAGRLEDRPLRIKGEVFPYRDGLNVDAMLNWLESNGFIRRYTAQGKKCILVLEFVKHQNPHKNETESELPAPSDECTKPEEIGTTSEIIGSTHADSLSSDSLIPDTPILNSVPIGTGGKPPITDPDEIIFGYGVPMLTNAGTAEKQARSFLGGLRKHHGDAALINKLRECAKAKPLQPLEWLAAALPPAGAAPKLNSQEALEASNRAIAARFLAEEAIHESV
jgi:hypothetical protein